MQIANVYALQTYTQMTFNFWMLAKFASKAHIQCAFFVYFFFFFHKNVHLWWLLKIISLTSSGAYSQRMHKANIRIKRAFALLLFCYCWWNRWRYSSRDYRISMQCIVTVLVVFFFFVALLILQQVTIQQKLLTMLV